MNALTVYDNIPDPIVAMKTLGHSIAHSKMFGCETEEQGHVMALECMARRCPPMQLAQRFHLIKGKLSMKAEAMLSDFCEKLGGNYKIVERTAVAAAIELTVDGKTETFSLSWEQALGEPFVYSGREDKIIEALAAGQTPDLKPKYATPRSRMQMLWSRVVSDGVRAMKPQVTSGMHTPEEVSDYPELAGGETEAPATTIESVPAAEAEAAQATDEAVPFDVPPEVSVEMIDGPRIIEINTLFAQLNIPQEKRESALRDRGATSISDLTLAAADEILEILRHAAKVQTEKLVVTPCTKDEQDEIRRQIVAVAQSGKEDIADEIIKKLHSCGKTVLADLSSEDAQLLIESLKTSQMEAFFTRSLEDFAS